MAAYLELLTGRTLPLIVLRLAGSSAEHQIDTVLPPGTETADVPSVVPGQVTRLACRLPT